MPQNDTKVWATASVWIGLGFAIAITNADQPLNGYSIAITVILVIAALLGTILLWVPVDYFFKGSEPAEKAKRSSGDDSRVALLLELLNDDERAALKQHLIDDLSSDGEAVTLAELLAAQESEQRKAGS